MAKSFSTGDTHLACAMVTMALAVFVFGGLWLTFANGCPIWSCPANSAPLPAIASTPLGLDEAPLLGGPFVPGVHSPDVLRDHDLRPSRRTRSIYTPKVAAVCPAALPSDGAQAGTGSTEFGLGQNISDVSRSELSSRWTSLTATTTGTSILTPSSPNSHISPSYLARGSFTLLDSSTTALPFASKSPDSSPSPSIKMTVKDIFAEPISDKPPPATMKVEAQHPVPRKGIAARAPLPTNKFFSNFFLGDQSAPTFTFPYSIWWASGRGIPGSYGMAISHTEAGQRVFGEAKFNDAASYFFNPVGIQSMVVSATELGNRTKLTMDEVTAFSTRVSLAPDGNSAPAVSFPLVQGMAFITAQYNGTTPLIQSGVFFKTVTKVTAEPKPGVTKFNFRLEDGTLWHMYAWTTNGEEFNMQVVNNGSAVALRPFHGMIQVCKDPGSPGSEQLLDDGAGIYPVTVQLTGSVSQALGTYRFTFVKEGHQMGNLYMFALPHHVESFDNATRRQVQHSQLQTTTKGVATLTRGTIWAMTEPHMPVNMGFAPWSLAKGSVQTLSDRSKELIRETAARELSQNMTVQTGLDSMYFSGKVSKARRL